MAFRNNSVSCEPANDCHQMTFVVTRSTAGILIKNLRHRHGLPLTRPAVLLGEGRPDTRERRENRAWLSGHVSTMNVLPLLFGHFHTYIHDVVHATRGQNSKWC